MPGQSAISTVLTHLRCRLGATLCSSVRLVGLLLSRETDENLGELLDIGWITTFVTDTKPSGVGMAHVSLPVCVDVHTHHFLEEGQVPGTATRSGTGRCPLLCARYSTRHRPGRNCGLQGEDSLDRVCFMEHAGVRPLLFASCMGVSSVTRTSRRHPTRPSSASWCERPSRRHPVRRQGRNDGRRSACRSISDHAPS